MDLQGDKHHVCIGTESIDHVNTYGITQIQRVMKPKIL